MTCKFLLQYTSLGSGVFWGGASAEAGGPICDSCYAVYL